MTNLDFHPPEFVTVSPEYAVPKLMKVLLPVPKTVLDFGCNIGAWLAAFKKNDKKIAVHGVDGDNMREHLLIDSWEFTSADLSRPFELGHKADLVLCLETAEHLPPESAETIVRTCVAHATNYIAFSAAKPGQGGYKHLNEQLIGYWIEKFEEEHWKVAYGYPPMLHPIMLIQWPQKVYPYHRRMIILKPAHLVDDRNRLKAKARKKTTRKLTSIFL